MEEFRDLNQNLNTNIIVNVGVPNEDDIYALVFNNGNNYECLYIQADEALKQAIASRHPHNLHL